MINWDIPAINPSDIAMLAAEVKAMRATDVLTQLIIRSTSIGPDGRALQVPTGRNSPQYHTYTLTAGETSINWRKKNVVHSDIMLLAAWMGRPNVLPTLTKLNLRYAPIFGSNNANLTKPDKFVHECEPFFAALKESSVAELNLANTGMGPIACGKLASSLPYATIANLDVRGNRLDNASWAALKAATPITCTMHGISFQSTHGTHRANQEWFPTAHTE